MGNIISFPAARIRWRASRRSRGNIRETDDCNPWGPPFPRGFPQVRMAAALRTAVEACVAPAIDEITKCRPSLSVAYVSCRAVLVAMLGSPARFVVAARDMVTASLPEDLPGANAVAEQWTYYAGDRMKHAGEVLPLEFAQQVVATWVDLAVAHYASRKRNDLYGLAQRVFKHHGNAGAALLAQAVVDMVRDRFKL